MTDSGAVRLQNEKLKTASEHIGDNWLPLNSGVFKIIVEKIENNFYENDKEQLINDLKGDIGLLTFSIKELSKLSDQKHQSIYESLRNCCLKEFRKILDKCKQASSKHKLSESSYEQINQLNSMLTSSAISETLAGANKLDSETAFLAAIFRKVGLTFIAWNYPNVFKNCLGSSGTEEELTENLNRALGFSPAMLGIRLAKEWEMPLNLIEVMDPSKDPPSDPEVSQAATSIVQLCKIGELLASLNNDNYQIKQEGSWNHARNEILKNLGSKGFKLIEENINRISKHYLSVLPALSTSSLARKIEQFSKSSSGHTLYHSNAYVKFLAKDIQDDLRDFYSLITPEGLSKDSVSFLHSRLIPSMGFTTGCLYLVDPVSHALIPRLALGDSKLSAYESFNILAHENAEHPLLKAFVASTPVVKHDDEGNEVIFLYGALGSLQRSGVLQLELSQALRKNNKVNPVLYFRSLIRALEDCLGLR